MKRRMAKSLAVLMCLLTAVAFMPTFAFAAEGDGQQAKPVTYANITVRSQAYNSYMHPVAKVKVASDEAEQFGFTDSVDGVSALDALVAAHEIACGEEFTPETAGEFLEVSSSGWVNKVFGEDSPAFGFLVNAFAPNDGVKQTWGYTLNLITQQPVVSGDVVDFYFYMDTTSWTDAVTFVDAPSAVVTGQEFEATVSAICGMSASEYLTAAEFKAAAEPTYDAGLAWVNVNSGEVNFIEDAITDDDGKAKITAPEKPGNYYLTAVGDELGDYSMPAIMNPVLIKVVKGDPKTGSITVKCTISKYGKIVETKDGDLLANKAVTVIDTNSNGMLDIDDALIAAHDAYYDGGAYMGYDSSYGDWGLSVDKLWGDKSGKFGYQVERGSVYVGGLETELTEGQHLDATVYANYYPDTEGYAYFDIYEKSMKAGQTATLTLKYASGYDANWNTIYSPCADAVITVDGKETKVKTDANGVAKVRIDKAGTHVVSAVKTKVVDGKEVAAITAPVCTVTVKAPVVAKTTLKSVKKGKKKATVKWKKTSGITGYQISYQPKGAAKASYAYASAKATKKVIKKLPRKKKCTFKVRAYVKVGSEVYYGPWSKAKTVKIR